MENMLPYTARLKSQSSVCCEAMMEIQPIATFDKLSWAASIELPLQAVTQSILVTDRHIRYQTFCHIVISQVCGTVLFVA